MWLAYLFAITPSNIKLSNNAINYLQMHSDIIIAIKAYVLKACEVYFTIMHVTYIAKWL